MKSRLGNRGGKEGRAKVHSREGRARPGIRMGRVLGSDKRPLSLTFFAFLDTQQCPGLTLELKRMLWSVNVSNS